MKNKKLEGWGLILILISFGWQFLEINLQETSNNVDKYQIHEKIDDIYMIVADAFSNSEYYKGEIRSNVNFDLVNQKWKSYYALKKEKENIEEQVKWTLYLKSILFVVGSVLLIIPKFRAD